MQPHKYSYSIVSVNPDTNLADPNLDPDFHVSVYGACSVPAVGDFILLAGGSSRARAVWIEHLVSLFDEEERMECLDRGDGMNDKAAYAMPLVGVVVLPDSAAGSSHSNRSRQ